MPQQEFLAIEQRPDHVFPRRPPIARLARCDLIAACSSARRLATNRREIELAQKIGIACTRPRAAWRSGLTATRASV